jgi:hypothetical protein
VATVPEGVAIDDKGNLFGAQAAAKDLKKYLKTKSLTSAA